MTSAEQVVAVCIATRSRPHGLCRLLQSLDEVRSPAGCRIEVLIVDNAGPGEERILGAPTSRWPVTVVQEPRTGIPHARNRALAHVIEYADWVAFVDDDETVDSQWLHRLMTVAHVEDVKVVTGPNPPIFEQPPPQWATDGRLFEPVRYATGTRLDRAFTNNLMIASSVLRTHQPWFDEVLALTGGSDTEFTRRLARRGVEIAWVDDALTYEHIPASRVTVRWILQRAWRVGTQVGWLQRHRPDSSRPARLLKTLRRVGIVLVGLVSATVLVPLDRGRALRRLRAAVTAAGYFAGWLGVRYREYAAVDPRRI